MADQPGVPRHRRRRRRSQTVRLALAAAGWCLAAAAPDPAAAATVFADPAGVCAGLLPCFTTLQGAVDNAAPAPATVGVFPGTYAESVDLDSMGSAAGGGPGDVTFQALDAGGMPAKSGVLVDPGAPSGPGTGPAIEAGGQMGSFPGAVALHGLALTSPDSVGLGCICDGDIELHDVLLEGCGGSGAFAVTLGAFHATDVVARLNGDVGLVAGGSGATFEDILVERNDERGALLVADGPLVVRRIQATANGQDGLFAVSCTSAEIEDVTADVNGGDGATFIVDLEGECVSPVEIQALPSSLERFELRVVFPPAPSGRIGFGDISSRAGVLPVGVLPVVLTVTGLSATGNDSSGAVVVAGGMDLLGGSVFIDDAVAAGNGDSGLLVLAEEIELNNGTFTDNLTGLRVQTGSALISQVVASDNAPAVFTPPGEGAGVDMFSAFASELLDVEAERNAFAGLVLRSSEFFPVFGPYRITGGLFADNDLGIVSEGEALVDVEIDGAEVADNLVTGIALPNLRQGLLRDAAIVGNDSKGLTSRVSGELEVRESEIADNREGISLVVQPGANARVHCSNVRNNGPGPGLRLSEGDAVDARANFWGDPSGPTHPGNPGGLGDEVRDGANGGAGVVTYSGFLAGEATADDCIEPPVVEIPALGGLGLALLVTLLVLAGLAALRGR